MWKNKKIFFCVYQSLYLCSEWNCKHLWPNQNNIYINIYVSDWFLQIVKCIHWQEIKSWNKGASLITYTWLVNFEKMWPMADLVTKLWDNLWLLSFNLWFKIKSYGCVWKQKNLHKFKQQQLINYKLKHARKWN